MAGAVASAAAIVAGFPPILGLPVAAFVLVGPGLAVVRLLGLGDRLLELVLGVGLSIGMTGLLLVTQLYAGLWSPAATLAILIGVATGAVIADPVVVPRTAWARLGAGSSSMGRAVRVGLQVAGGLVVSVIGAMSVAFVKAGAQVGPRTRPARAATRTTGTSLAAGAKNRSASARLATRTTGASVAAGAKNRAGSVRLATRTTGRTLVARLKDRAGSVRLALRTTSASVAARIGDRAGSVRLALLTTGISVAARLRTRTPTDVRPDAAAGSPPSVGSTPAKRDMGVPAAESAPASAAPRAGRRMPTPAPVRAPDRARGPSFVSRVRAAVAGFREPDLLGARHEPASAGSGASAGDARPSPQRGTAQVPGKAAANSRAARGKASVPVPMRPTRITVAAAAKAPAPDAERVLPASRLTRARSAGRSIARRAEDASKRLTGAPDAVAAQPAPVVAPPAVAAPPTSRRRPQPATLPEPAVAIPAPSTQRRRQKPAPSPAPIVTAVAPPAAPSTPRRRSKPTSPSAAETAAARSPGPAARSQSRSANARPTPKPTRQRPSGRDRPPIDHPAPASKPIAARSGSRRGDAKSTRGIAPSPAVDWPKVRPGPRAGRNTRGADPPDPLASPQPGAAGSSDDTN
jgi:hypothetical protein